MKVAVSSVGDNMSSQVADVFGRCPYFIIVDIIAGKIKKTEAIKNISMDQAGGAGMAAAKLIAEKGVEVVISNNVGPRAMDVLNQFRIKVVAGSGTVAQSLQDYIVKTN